LGLGSIRQDVELESHACNKKNSVVDDFAFVSVDEGNGIIRDDYGKVLFESEPDLKQLIQMLHSSDHPGSGEMLKRLSYIVSSESPALVGKGHLLRSLSNNRDCMNCILCKPHVAVKKMIEGKRKLAKRRDSDDSSSEPDEPNRLIYPKGRFPFEQVHLDIMGPWFGDLHAVVLVDSYSKFALVEAVRGTPTSEICIRLLLKLRSGLYTMPRRVITDQGRQFISSDFKDAVKSLGAELRHTGTAAHWQNGQAERFIGDLGSRLTACLQEASVSTLEDRNEVAKVFVEKLTDIVFAHNQWPRAAGASPASMVFAYPTWIDIGLVKYRPFREKFLFDLDPGNLDAARKELSDGPKVGELWKLKSFTPHKKGEPRYELVRIISAEGQGDFLCEVGRS
jgi:transposase InsO family protein